MSTIVPQEFQDFLLLLAFVRANADPERGIHRSEVARRLGIPEARVMEYVARLSMCGRPPFSPEDLISIEIDDEGYVVLYFDLDQSMAAPARLSTPEAAGLSLALRALIDSSEPASSEHARTALEKVTAALSRDVGNRVAAVTSRVDVADDGVPEKERLATLRRAIERTLEVELDYHSAYRDSLGRRRVRPYGLVRYRGHWYLAGEDAVLGQVRRFRLDRIRRLATTDAVFERPRDVERHTQFSGKFFVTDGVNVRTARVRFHPPLSRRLASEWRPSRITKEGSGAIVAALEFVEPAGLANWLLGFGEHVEVLEPADLKDELRERCRRVLEIMKQ